MKKVFIAACIILIGVWVLRVNFNLVETGGRPAPDQGAACKEIVGTVCSGETLFDIFRKYGLDVGDLFVMKEASADVHRLREISPGQPYKITVDDRNRIDSFEYRIDDDFILNISRTESGFEAEKTPVGYEKGILHVAGEIEDNLVSSVGEGREDLLLALDFSDIFAWDIDFTSDLRRGDFFKVVVEGLYLQGEFRKYGDILSAEFSNNGETYRAYRFERDGKAGYYDAEGKSLKKAFLKAPLSFRRISSGFSKGRFHPILKIYRPHHGLDYAAPSGTPVSAVGDGKVIFAGRRGQYGKLVVIQHRNGWRTYYGHLSKIEKGVKKGTKVAQGMMIGRVGSTGLATGPHLHFEVRVKDRPVNPLTLRLPREDSIPGPLRPEFADFRKRMDTRLALIAPPVVAFAGAVPGNPHAAGKRRKSIEEI